MIHGHDLHGDGVKVAARLEPLADPGGICISATVHEHVQAKLPYPFEDRGEQRVKNISTPVRIYMIGPDTIAQLPIAVAAARMRWNRRAYPSRAGRALPRPSGSRPRAYMHGGRPV